MKPVKSIFLYILGMSLLTITNIISSNQKSLSEIIPDQTLGTNINNSNPAKIIIEGGTEKGINLFHSFEKFNVSENGNVYFFNPTGVENILTRVTGSNASQILGKLGVEGSANLYLINPQGIYFGNNASLDIVGSFIATTADSITLGENGLFSATAPNSSNLLSIAPNALFINALNNQEATIENHANLKIADGSNITLFAANINNLGELTASGGNIELTATGNIIVQGNIDTTNPTDDAGNIKINSTQGNIKIEDSSLKSNTSTVDGKGGDITISAGEIGDIPAIQLTDTTIDATGFGANGESGEIRITATNNGEIRLLGQTYQPNIYSDTFATDIESQGKQTGGNIQIQGGNININNYNIDNTVRKDSYGNGGKIEIIGNKINIENNSRIKTEVQTGSLAKSGDIFIKGYNSVQFQNSHIIASNESEGVAGNIKIHGDQLVSLTNSKINSNSQNINEGYSEIEIKSKTGSINLNNVTLDTSTSGTSDAGTLALNAGDTININNQSTLSSQGKDGYIFIDSQQLNIDSSTLTTNNSTSNSYAGFMKFTITKLAEINSSNLFSEGNLGYIDIDSPLLTINNTKINTNSPNSNDYAGYIKFSSLEKLQLVNSTLNSQGQRGDILIESPNVVINNSIFNTTNSYVKDAINESIDSGYISIQAANKISIFNNSKLIAFTQRRGNAGNITLNSPTGSITINNDSLLSSSIEANGIGKGGYIQMNTQKLQLLGGTEIKTYVEPGGAGDAGNINLKNLNTLEINNSQISATSIDGQAGNIDIDAKNSVEITKSGNIFVESTGTGVAGSLNINTDQFLISDGAKISASNNNGAGGSINITANKFTANNAAQLVSSTSGNAEAGNIVLKVKDNITLDGVNTGIFASTNPGSSGDSGSINIDPEIMIIQNGAGIGVNSKGTGKGGDISLKANTLTLDNNAFITADTASNQGGEIYLTIGNLLFLRHDSNISATAGKIGAGGNGGNINIDAPFILGVATENSDITANAFSGNGGNITINAQSIVGLEFREKQTDFSDITASSKFGLSGNVEINSLNIDPSQGLMVLTNDFIDASRQLTPGCRKIAKDKNKFTIVGKGGLSSDPNDLFTGIMPIVDIINIVSDQKITKPVVIESQQKNLQNRKNRVIQQAQGWIINDYGQVILTASAPQVTSGYVGIKDSVCQNW
uniref:Filamentous hemagglutinin family domain-containing protein n=1 Tax=Anabaena sp. XPORK15F TaxID=462641 RepID=A0A0U3BIB9_9NOST|nr:filamentous hemagglutinin family domain-containing protein [Anabaena sp. XPORK15F]